MAEAKRMRRGELATMWRARRATFMDFPTGWRFEAEGGDSLFAERSCLCVR
jgi:hypothetical protein